MGNKYDEMARDLYFNKLGFIAASALPEAKQIYKDTEAQTLSIIAQAIRMAVEEEREKSARQERHECALVAEFYGRDVMPARIFADKIATAIRSRSQS